MLRNVFVLCAVMVLIGLQVAVGHAQIVESGAATIECASVESADLSHTIDAPTQIISASTVRAQNGMPQYCDVRGYVAPNVGIKLGLPWPWNGKFIQVGCGGTCGNVELAFSAVNGCKAALRKGYACVASDAGHTGAWVDGLWGYGNTQAKLDWGYRAAHVTALAGKAITEFYYETSPRKSYFIGGSNGGREALQQAQRFPWNFDGIVALAPAIDISTVEMIAAWGFHVTHDTDGKPLLGSEDLKLVTEAAVAKCDLDDGVKDDVIGNPLHCLFDPSQLACQADHTAGCLTPTQVSAVQKVYAGPMSSRGVSLTFGGPLVGTEFGNGTDGGWQDRYIGRDGKPSFSEIFAAAAFRYLLFQPEPGPTWTLRDFNFDRDPKRLRLMQAIYDASHPDLRKFKAAGGKLLIFQGVNDIATVPRDAIDYYEMVERTMGGREATQSFARLFLLPGVSHGGRGDIGAGTLDYLGALEAWVEDGKAPDRLIAARMKESQSWTLEFPFPLDPGKVQFTRPVYPYPLRAKYEGRGDHNDAVNFGPVDGQ
jgi:feruloyl esterase